MPRAGVGRELDPCKFAPLVFSPGNWTGNEGGRASGKTRAYKDMYGSPFVRGENGALPMRLQVETFSPVQGEDVAANRAKAIHLELNVGGTLFGVPAKTKAAPGNIPWRALQYLRYVGFEPR